MDPTVLFWSRLQFAWTQIVHYIFPPLSIGLLVFLVVVGAIYLKTRNPVWLQVGRFWVRVFALTFTIGVATGIPMEFQFGTNWAGFSRYVGDVFGSALAAEGIFAFFLESGFLAIVLFGGGRVPPWLHYLSIVMVCVGAHFSATWIVVADSWMQTPAGFHIVQGPHGLRAEVTDFWAMVLCPSSAIRLTHVIMGAYLGGAFLVMSVSAWYLLHKRHVEFARASMSVALPIAVVVSLAQLLYSGHESAKVVAHYQPVKFAAMEGHWSASAPAEMTIFGYIDPQTRSTRGLKIPGLTSWLLHGDAQAPVTGLVSVPPEDRPPLQITFQCYHLMIMIGMGLIALSLLASISALRGRLAGNRLLLWLLVLGVLGPILANELGWIAAEVGRQPWIVQGLMRTSEGVSPNISAGQAVFSTLLFVIVYVLLLAVFIYVLNEKIKHGPEPLESIGPIIDLRGQLKKLTSHGRAEA